MGILEMDFERILGVPFFLSSSHSIMLCDLKDRVFTKFHRGQKQILMYEVFHPIVLLGGT